MTSELYGIAAEFADPDSLVDAAIGARDRGYRRIEAYTPYPIHQLENAIEDRRALPPVVFIGGLLGFFTAWAMEFYIAVVDYPINVGGRPLNSWPSFIVIMFELTVLFASIFAFCGFLYYCGFPRPHHPMFNLSNFAQASSHRFFLCIEATDPLFDPCETAEFLAGTNSIEVVKVNDD
jgi:hypothetical protein